MVNIGKEHGFTLLEVMISIAILGVMMTLIWSSSSQSLNAKDRTEARDMAIHMARVVLRKVSDDISMAFLAKQALTPSPGLTPQAAAASTGVKTFFIGEDKSNQDSFKLSTLSHLRLFRDGKESDQSKVSYEVVSSKEEFGELNLVRREDPWLDGTTEVKGKELMLAENIRAFNLEYYNERKREWVKNWDSEKVDWRGRLPLAVKIIIAFPDPDDEELEIQLSTAVMIALSENAIEI